MKCKNFYQAIGQELPNGKPKVIGTFAKEELAAQEVQKFVDDHPENILPDRGREARLIPDR